MVKIGTNITLFGNCKKAIEFYKKVFENSNAEIITFGEMKELLGGDAIVGDKVDYVYNARFEITSGSDKFYFFLCDSPSILFSSSNGANKDNITIVIEFEKEDDVQKYYNLLMENGKSNISPRKNPAGVMESSLIDSFGVCWILRSYK